MDIIKKLNELRPKLPFEEEIFGNKTLPPELERLRTRMRSRVQQIITRLPVPPFLNDCPQSELMELMDYKRKCKIATDPTPIATNSMPQAQEWQDKEDILLEMQTQKNADGESNTPQSNGNQEPQDKEDILLELQSKLDKKENGNS